MQFIQENISLFSFNWVRLSKVTQVQDFFAGHRETSKLWNTKSIRRFHITEEQTEIGSKLRKILALRRLRISCWWEACRKDLVSTVLYILLYWPSCWWGVIRRFAGSPSTRPGFVSRFDTKNFYYSIWPLPRFAMHVTVSGTYRSKSQCSFSLSFT